MKKSILLGLTLGCVITVGVSSTAFAKTNQYKVVDTQKVTKGTYISANASAVLWNMQHTKKLVNLRNYPKTTWYVTKAVTLRHNQKNAIFSQVKSANGKHQGLVWHGYLKPGNYFKNSLKKYHAATIISDFNHSVAKIRSSQAQWDNRPNSPVKMPTVTSPQFNALASNFQQQLTKKDYQDWDHRESLPHYERSNALNDRSFDLAWHLGQQAEKQYGLQSVELHNYGYVNLKTHPTQAVIIKSLDKQIVKIGGNAEEYSGSENNVVYTGASVRIDQKKGALYLIAAMGMDTTTNSAIKQNLR